MNKEYKIYTLSSSNDLQKIRYVGVTSKKNIKTRLYQHIYNAKHKKTTPVAKWIFKQINLGYKILITEIEKCSESNWEIREQYHIGQYRIKYPDLLNVDIGEHGVITKEKRNIDGITRSIEAHKKKVVAISLDGQVTFFDSVKATANQLNVVKSAVGNALHKRTKRVSNYYIMSVDDYNNIKNDIYKYITECNTKFSAKRTIYQYDANGNYVTYYNDTTQLPYSYEMIREALKQKIIYKDYIWSLEFGKKINIDDYKYIKKDNTKVLYIYNNYQFTKAVDLANYCKISVSTVRYYIYKNKPINGLFVQTIKIRN